MIDKNIDPNNFTQKDLMLHLLQVSQHTVTREEVKEDISQIDKKLDKQEKSIDSKFDKVDVRFDKLEKSIDERFNKVDVRFDKLEKSIDERFNKVDEKFNKVDVRFDKLDNKISKISDKFEKIQYLIIASILTVLFKDHIFSLLQH